MTLLYQIIIALLVLAYLPVLLSIGRLRHRLSVQNRGWDKLSRAHANAVESIESLAIVNALRLRGKPHPLLGTGPSGLTNPKVSKSQLQQAQAFSAAVIFFAEDMRNEQRKLNGAAPTVFVPHHVALDFALWWHGLEDVPPDFQHEFARDDLPTLPEQMNVEAVDRIVRQAKALR